MATISGLASSASIAWLVMACARLVLAAANGVGPDSRAAQTSSPENLKAFKYVEPDSMSSLTTKSARKALKAGKLIQNLTPLEYDLELDFSQTGRFANSINGLVQIYVQFASLRKCDKKKLALTKTIRGVTEAMSCKMVLADQRDGSRFITLHVGEGVTVREATVEVGASLEALRRNRGEKIQVESQQTNEQSRVMTLSLAKPFEMGSFGRILVRFESLHKYDFVKYSPRRTAPNEPPGSPLEAFVNFRFIQASIERTFPCVNSPKFKSKVSLTIVADRKLSAYSNMPASDIRDDPKGRRNLRGELLRRTVFAPTPPIPIHRLVYSLGPFEEEPNRLVVASGGSGQTWPARIRLVAPALLTSPSRASFALELASAAFDWMTRKMGQKLPIKQFDLIATHARDFNHTSALGCALIDANQLLLDPVESSPEARLKVAWNVALAVAQQWFGGLVTERHRRDHWIVDGLAGQLALEMLSELRPEMGVGHYVRSHLLTRALYIRAIRLAKGADALGDDQKQDLARELIQLSYIKSVAIVGMLKTIVGEDKFQTIVRKLVQRGASGDDAASNSLLVDQAGLVAQLASPDKPTEELSLFVDAWRSHPSFPALSVQPEQSDPDRAIQMYQIPIHKLTQVEIGLWPNRNGVQIPLKIMFNDCQGTRRETVQMENAFREVRPGEVPKWNGQLVEAPEWFSLRDFESGHWLKLLADPGTLPFFIVHYTASGNIVHRFKSAIENFAMGPEDRASLLRDATTLLLAKPQLQPSVPYDELAAWFQNERVIQVIDAALSLERAIQGKTRRVPVLAVKLFERHGFLAARPRESEFEQMVRSAALLDLVRSGHKRAIETALKISELEPLRAESALLKPAIYAALTRAGSQQQLESLFERLHTSKWPEEINRLRSALEGSGDVAVRARVALWCEANNCEV